MGRQPKHSLLPCVFWHTYTTFFMVSRLREAQATEGRPSEARTFNELRRYHTRPSQLNWGPKNVQKRILGFQIINARIVQLITKI